MINTDMSRKIATKTIVCYCRKYDLYFFRVGPLVPVKIELAYFEDGQILCNIIEGLKISNFEKLFKKELKSAISDFIKEITFYFKRKKIISDLQKKRQYETPVPPLNVFKGETDVIKKSVMKRKWL